MMYLLLSIVLVSTYCTSLYGEKGQAISSQMQDNQNQTLSVGTDAVGARTIISMETEISLKKLATIYKKLLHDQDAISREYFEDENLRGEVSKIIEERINTVRSVLGNEAPELAAAVEYEYAEPRRKFIIYGSIAVVVLGAGILALFSYDPATGTWGAPQTAHAQASLTKIAEKITGIFENDSAAIGSHG